MPLDFAVLLRSTPSAIAFAPRTDAMSSHLTPYGYLVDGGPSGASSSPSTCRRVSSFPLVHNQAMLKSSNLKYRSISESNNLANMISSAFLDFNSKNDVQIENAMEKIVEEIPLCAIHDKIENKDDSEDDSVSERRSSISSGGAKKKVAFADDKGLELISVKVMTEASDVPPKINYSAIMRSLLGDEWTDEEVVAKPCATWVVNFKQPASEYLSFRQKLETNNVAVENVLVKNDHSRLIGTIKVKNLYFEKDVFVRFTDNEWRSYYDRTCKYVPSRNTATDLYDTFEFDFEIPYDDAKHQRIEFCVCYKTGRGQESWDNNEGRNFEIIGERLRSQRNQYPRMNNTNQGNGDSQHTDDAMSLHCKNWAEFASWNDLNVTENAYW